MALSLCQELTYITPEQESEYNSQKYLFRYRQNYVLGLLLHSSRLSSDSPDLNGKAVIAQALADRIILEWRLDPVLKATDIALATHFYLFSSPGLPERRGET